MRQIHKIANRKITHTAIQVEYDVYQQIQFEPLVNPKVSINN